MTESSPKPKGFFGRAFFLAKLLEIRLRFVAILLVTALLVGYWDHVQNYLEKWQRHREAATAAAHSHAGAHGSHTSGTLESRTNEQTFEYFCPMHQFVVRDQDGKCPICGMNLSKRVKGAPVQLPEGALARVQVSPDRINQTGVQVEAVERRNLTRVVRSYGAVELDETRTAKITARFPGRIDRQWVNSTGLTVKKGDPLVQIYSPKFLAATQEYMQALSMKKQADKNPGVNADDKARAGELARFARQRLALAGFTPDQLDAMENSGHAEERMVLKSPLSGTVLERNLQPGELAEEGTVLYNIADLSVVWVQILVLESDMGAVRKGMPVEVTSVAWPGSIIHGTIDFIYPTLMAEARAVKVRVVVQNADGRLRPGMYVNAVMRSPLGRFELLGEKPPAPDTKTSSTASAAAAKPVYTCPMHPEVISDKPGDCPKCGMPLELKPASKKDSQWMEGWACSMHPDELSDKPGICTICDCGMRKEYYRLEKILSVPESAVIDTGERKIVYVETMPGVFDAHAVALGARAGEWYPVQSGLSAGEKIVTRGAFLIDAEARLNPEQH